MTTNRAAWLMSKQAKPFTIGEAPMLKPKKGEVIIRNYAIAMNPVDAGIQNMGILWEEYPAIIGSDLAGEVFQVGPGVTGLQKGDRVIACVGEGAFQLYTAADIRLVAKLPDKISYAQGAVLPLALTTAANIFHPNNLGLSPPQLNPKPNNHTMLVWGGASAVGSCAIQMIKAAGYDVITIASPRNFGYCKELGASAVFDYKDETIVERIVEAFEGKHFAGAFRAIFVSPGVIRDCLQIADKLGRDEKTRVVSTVLPSNMPYTDAVPESGLLRWTA